MGRIRFFRRKSLGFEPSVQIRFEPVEGANYDAFLMTPVIDGMWRQHETWDGTYTLSDLLDAHEMLAVREENRRRADEQSRIESEMNRHHR